MIFLPIILKNFEYQKLNMCHGTIYSKKLTTKLIICPATQLKLTVHSYQFYITTKWHACFSWSTKINKNIWRSFIAFSAIVKIVTDTSGTMTSHEHTISDHISQRKKVLLKKENGVKWANSRLPAKPDTRIYF